MGEKICYLYYSERKILNKFKHMLSPQKKKIKVCISMLIILCHFLEHFTHTCIHTVEENCSNTWQKKNFLKKYIYIFKFICSLEKRLFYCIFDYFFFHCFEFTSRKSTNLSPCFLHISLSP